MDIFSAVLSVSEYAGHHVRLPKTLRRSALFDCYSLHPVEPSLDDSGIAIEMLSRKPRRGLCLMRGFTLIEVMVVVVILGILAAVIVPRIMDRPEQARLVKAKQDIRVLEAALQGYKLDNLAFPSTDQGLEALVQKPSGTPEPLHWKTGGYIARLPKDPWGNAYRYLNPGAHGEIDVYSIGPDVQNSSDDIGNWNLE